MLSRHDLSAQVVSALAELCATSYADVLHDYRLVHNIADLDMGKHVRWIRRVQPDRLTSGGIVVGVQDTNMRVLCINRIIINVNFRACVVFQKLSPDELLIANAISYM
jgi:hypothetical protein